MTRMKKISKQANQGDKENTNYLEEVEKNILNRRKGGQTEGNSSDRNYSSRKFLATTGKLAKSTACGKGALSKTSSKKLPLGQTVTPESLYNTYNNEKGVNSGAMPSDEQLMSRMANELNLSMQKIKELQGKLKGLEEGQMTVDNLEYSKKLDDEREALNAERMAMLKDYATKADQVEKDRQKFEKDKNANEEAYLQDKTDLDTLRKEIELQKLQQKALEDDIKSRNDILQDQETALKAGQVALAKEKKAAEDGQQELADYRVELEELKDRLLKERDRLQQDKARAEGERESLEQEIKALKNMKDGLEKEREKELKDISKRKRELEFEEDRVKRESDRVKNEEERVRRDKYRAEEEIKKHKSLCDEVEEEKLQLWQDRNALNKEIKQFIEDRKSMENDLKWREKELQQIDEELQEESKVLEKQAEELEEFELELEAKQNDLEARESLLLHEREDFSKLKLKFLDGLIESGGLAHLTPELKQMAKNMGIDVDELEKEKSKIDSRKKEIEKLQKQHEDEMKAMAAKGSKTTSRRGSISGGIGRRASIALGLRPNLLAGKTFVNAKVTVESYLNDLYDTASSKYTVRQLKENRATIDRLLEEKEFSVKLVEQLRNQNKALKKDFDLLSKVIDQYRSEGMNIDVATLLGRHKPKDASTETDRDKTFDEERDEYERKIRELENKLKRGGIRSGSMADTASDFDDENFNAKLQEIQEQLKNLLKQISDEQQEFEKRGLPEISNRIVNIHYLVYSFMQDIIQFLIRFNKPRDKVQREMFAKILSNVDLRKPSQLGPRNTTERVQGVESFTGDAQDALRKYQDRIRDLEGKNATLKDLVEGLKSTFEFFELANDQYIMQKH